MEFKYCGVNFEVFGTYHGSETNKAGVLFNNPLCKLANNVFINISANFRRPFELPFCRQGDAGLRLDPRTVLFYSHDSSQLLSSSFRTVILRFFGLSFASPPVILGASSLYCGCPLPWPRACEMGARPPSQRNEAILIVVDL